MALKRPPHLVRRQTEGSAFGMEAVLITAGTGSRDSNGLWNPSAGVETPLKLAQSPMKSYSDRETAAARRVEMATFYFTGQNAEALRTGSRRSSADRIRWDSEMWTVEDIEDYGELLVVNTGWDDPQANNPGYQDNELDRAVRQFVAQASGIPGNVVIPGNGPGPAPDTVFATVLRMTDIQRGLPAEQEDDFGQSHILLTRSDRNVLYQVEWYRAGAQHVAQRASDWMGTSLAADSANILGFHIQRHEELRDMDAIVSSEWEERWGMDLEISYFSDRRWDSNCIATAPFEVTLG